MSDEASGPFPLYPVRPAELAEFLGRLEPQARGFLGASGFAAKSGETQLLPGPGGLAGAVLGLGEEEGPWPFGAAPFGLPAGTAWTLEPGRYDAGFATLGWHLGAYRYDRHKPVSRAPARLATPPGTEEAVATAAAIWRARDLINMSAAELGPAELAGEVQRLADAHGGFCTVTSGEALEAGFPAIAAVGAGSPRAPRVAMMEWEGDPDGPLIAMCGKGVCFDTGGLDLKPSSGMLRMKKDMGGAAVVLATADLIMRAHLPVRLLVLIGAVENAISGSATRPMDVLRTRKGLTVEVGNTDAEGRLVLCDLLACAAERTPALLIDCATLTGAARVALGPDLPALFCNEDSVAEALLVQSRRVHDPLWRLPLHDGYDSWLDSNSAQLSNVSQRPMAGAITAALFLRRFVPAGLPWVHLDLYAWNDTNRAGRPEGGEGQAVRALYALVMSRGQK